MKNIECTFVVVLVFNVFALSQGVNTSGISLEHFDLYYNQGIYQVPGRTWNDIRIIFENNIKTMSSDSADYLRWKIMFAKYRFMNGEFKQFEDDVASIKDAIKKNYDQDIPLNLADIEEIEEQVIAAENEYDSRVINEQDPNFGNLYIKIRNEDVPEKRRVVYSTGAPVQISYKFPESGLDDLQKKRLKYLNNRWFRDRAMELGFFSNTKDLSSNFGQLPEGYVLRIPYLPILKKDQEYIFILKDEDGQTKRYRKAFHTGNFDTEMLAISYMEGWYLDPAPAPDEIEIKLPADHYTVQTTRGKLEAESKSNYEIGIRNALDQSLIDPMKSTRKDEKDGRDYFVYYIQHQQDLELDVFVQKKSVKGVKLRDFLAWAVILISITGYYAQ